MIHLRTLGAVELTGSDGHSIDTVAAQSKRFAILVYLAIALPRGWHRRDTLLALFWPELDQTHARHALRQALHFLRKSLGNDCIRTRGSEDVAAGPALWCDAAAFEDGELREATLALYRGELLPGFFIREAAPEWDHWVDHRREALRCRAAKLTERFSLREPVEPPAAPAASPRPRWQWPAFAAAAAIAALVLGSWIAPQRAMAHSALADSLYARGLTSLEGVADGRAALGWFEAAVQASPRFAMAAYYAGVSASAFDGPTADQWFNRAYKLASTASEHDRLVIETAVAFRADDPAALAIADTLVRHYPNDPLARHMLASSLFWSGDFPAALSQFRQELRLRPERDPGCTACQALDGIAASLQFLDSIDAAAQVAREAVDLEPQSLAAWNTVATMEAALGHFAAARIARRNVEDLTPGQPSDPLAPADVAIRRGDFVTADRLIRGAFEVGSAAGKRDALWLLIISLRNQGRLREAFTVARAYRRQAPDIVTPGLEAIPEAQVLFELGEFRHAALLFDSIGAIPTAGPRGRCWALTHAGEAWAAAGDTARVLVLADSIAKDAQHSLYGRDRRLPDHLRGLVWLARGVPDSALAHFQAAVFSPTNGYTRTNFELGRLLLATGRPREAAAIARAGLAGATDGSAYYLTRTSLHELAARAFAAAGEPDSAAVEFAHVARAYHTKGWHDVD